MPHAREHMLGLTTRPDHYHRLTGRLFSWIHTRVITDVTTANLPPGSRILDIGTGPGSVPIQISQRVPQVSIDGIDLSPQMIAYATTAARDAGCADRVTFHSGDAGGMPFDDDAFDLVVSSMSQHHWSDVPAIVREIRRVLRPGGRAWIYDARYVLRRAETAARNVFPAGSVSYTPIRAGRLPLRVFARVAIERGPDHGR